MKHKTKQNIPGYYRIYIAYFSQSTIFEDDDNSDDFPLLASPSMTYNRPTQDETERKKTKRNQMKLKETKLCGTRKKYEKTGLYRYLSYLGDISYPCRSPLNDKRR